MNKVVPMGVKSIAKSVSHQKNTWQAGGTQASHQTTNGYGCIFEWEGPKSHESLDGFRYDELTE